MLGYMVMAPPFGQMSRYIRIPALMCAGLIVWTIFAALTGNSESKFAETIRELTSCALTFFTAGLSQEFYSLTLFRAVIGIGEASFAGLAPTYIDDIAPHTYKTVRVFYLCQNQNSLTDLD